MQRSQEIKMPANKQTNLQEAFLSSVYKSQTPVTVYLINGIRLEGVISRFDQYCILLVRNGFVQLVYKHAISTVSRHSWMAQKMAARSPFCQILRRARTAAYWELEKYRKRKSICGNADQEINETDEMVP